MRDDKRLDVKLSLVITDNELPWTSDWNRAAQLGD